MKFVAIGLFAGLALAHPQRPSKGTAKSSGGSGSSGSSGSSGEIPELDPPKTKPTSNYIGTIAALTGKDGLLDAGIGPSTRTELNDGKACGKVIFIFARASTEVGNMGGSMGPQMCNALRKIYGEDQVICQGVGPNYKAAIQDNIGGIGTSRAAVAEATGMFQKAATKCPDAVIAFGGYSQGTAVMHATVGKLPKDIQERVVVGVLFGDTRNKQDRSQVPGFPKDKVEVFCDKNDGVCGGMLNVNAGHFVYTVDGTGQKAIKFLKDKLDAALATKGGSAKGGKGERKF
ncbi:hypothetical protein E2P81_ATG09852 [Venturia nashicola]|nr:hypothetical protein E2P81_ATG09852 [Venturia nashicola]